MVRTRPACLAARWRIYIYIIMLPSRSLSYGSLAFRPVLTFLSFALFMSRMIRGPIMSLSLFCIFCLCIPFAWSYWVGLHAVRTLPRWPFLGRVVSMCLGAGMLVRLNVHLLCFYFEYIGIVHFVFWAVLQHAECYIHTCLPGFFAQPFPPLDLLSNSLACRVGL